MEKKLAGIRGHVLTIHKTVFEWAVEYCGDPSSHTARGEKILEFLKEEGMTSQGRVLEIGCGALSLGKPLIEYLAPGHYSALEPGGWMVESTLAQYPALESQSPRFQWNTDFDGSGFGHDFSFIVAHSVLSHAAHWQLAQLLTNTRAVVNEGAVLLCSYRRAATNTFADSWVYPGHVEFRLETIKAAGLHAGWRVEEMREYQTRLREVAPHDVHDWFRATSVPSAAEANDFRLAEEATQSREREEREAWLVERRARLEAEDAP